ncbi:MAG: hypothetical protein P4L16_07520 [Chlamydiales bacterium]|nr:hypothetical protein [Chlamydiales bacterium]
MWNGLTCLKNIQENHLDALQLPLLRQKIYSQQNLHVLVTCDQSTFQMMKRENLFAFNQSGLANACTSKIDISIPKISLHLITTQFSNAFIYQTIPVVFSNHIDFPALCVAAALLLFLQINYSKAYHTHCEPNGKFGTLALHMSDVPSISKGLDTFKIIMEKLAKGDFSQSDLIQAQLYAIQGMNWTSAFSKDRATLAYHSFINGTKMGLLQEIQSNILNVSSQQVSEAVKNHILANMDKSVIAAFVNKDHVEKENKILTRQGRELPVIDLNICKQERCSTQMRRMLGLV